MTPAAGGWTEMVLLDFSGADGSAPSASLMLEPRRGFRPGHTV